MALTAKQMLKITNLCFIDYVNLRARLVAMENVENRKKFIDATKIEEGEAEYTLNIALLKHQKKEARELLNAMVEYLKDCYEIDVKTPGTVTNISVEEHKDEDLIPEQLKEVLDELASEHRDNDSMSLAEGLANVGENNKTDS